MNMKGLNTISLHNHHVHYMSTVDLTSWSNMWDMWP